MYMQIVHPTTVITEKIYMCGCVYAYVCACASLCVGTMCMSITPIGLST